MYCLSYLALCSLVFFVLLSYLVVYYLCCVLSCLCPDYLWSVYHALCGPNLSCSVPIHPVQIYCTLSYPFISYLTSPVMSDLPVLSCFPHVLCSVLPNPPCWTGVESRPCVQLAVLLSPSQL